MLTSALRKKAVKVGAADGGREGEEALLFGLEGTADPFRNWDRKWYQEGKLNLHR